MQQPSQSRLFCCTLAALPVGFQTAQSSGLRVGTSRVFEALHPPVTVHRRAVFFWRDDQSEGESMSATISLKSITGRRTDATLSFIQHSMMIVGLMVLLGAVKPLFLSLIHI